MDTFKVGDRVVLTLKQTFLPQYKNQVGTVTLVRSLTTEVQWADGNKYSYRSYDLIRKEPDMPSPRTIPSKNQVLKVAFSCPQTKAALKLLFPQDFEAEFDWADFEQNPFKYLEVTKPCSISPSKELEEAYENLGHQIPSFFTPLISLTTLKRLIDFLVEHKGGKK